MRKLTILLAILVVCVGCFAALMIIIRTKNSAYLSAVSTGPCWRKICPGTTDHQGVLAAFKEEHLADKDQIFDDEVNGVRITQWNLDSGPFSGVQVIARYKDNYVNEIELLLLNSLKLGDIIERLGEPDELLVTSDCIETRSLSVSLWYRDDGIIVRIFKPMWSHSDRWKVDPRQPVSRISYYDTRYYNEMIFLRDPLNGQQKMSSIQGHLSPYLGLNDFVEVWDLCS